MKYTMLTYCKYVLFGAALIPFLLIAFVMFPVLNWAWRIGAFLPFIVLFLWGALVLLKKLVLRLTEQHPQVLEQEEGQLENPAEERARLQDLQESWRQAVGTLKGSHLKQEGDPLYVLPWYLVMGESGSGKSTALKSAHLSSPFAELAGGGGGTRNCDWRFYDQGIVIDTAGRYAMPADAGRDEEEWREFLSLLMKYRRRDPINGLILTVSAEKLLKEVSRELENYGRQLRVRTDELMRFLGITFPVYLLITKCDLIGGMTEFCDLLPEQSLDQPMGLINEELSTDVPAFLERFCEGIDRRLRSLRLLLLHRPEARRDSASMLLLPDELRCLKSGLESFLPAAFGENHYQETPLLRGIYLCSASQPEIRRSASPQESAAPAAKYLRAGTGHGLFLHDFFEKVLPRDRGLWAPSARAVKRHSLAGNLALVAWLLMGVSLCGLLSYSFVKNMAVIREAAALVARTPELKGELPFDLAAMERMRRSIFELEQKNLNWLVPRFGLNRSREVEEALKARYCREFRDRFLVFFDRSLAAAVGSFSRSTPDQFFGDHVMHLSRRCNLLQRRLDGDPLPALAAKPLPDYLASPWRQGEAGPAFGNLYLNYLAWRADRKELTQELQRLQTLLKQAFVVKGTELGWLLGLADRQQPDAAITLREFWSGSLPLPVEPVIAPTFTRKGKECVSALLNELYEAYPEPGVLEREKAAFESWYRNACFAAWQRFAALMPQGAQRLLGPREWRHAAANMAGEKGAYFSFMSRAVTELETFGGLEVLPPWLTQLHRFQVLKSAGPTEGVASATGQGSKIVDKLGRLAGKPAGTPPAGVSGVDAARDYLNAVARIAPVAKSRSLAYQMAQEAFSASAEVGKSPLFQAADAAQRLNALLLQGEGDDTFPRLISGPITFYGTFIRMETACALQAQWEEKVLKEVQGASDPQTLQYLLGKDGPVWKYVGEFADPFIGWSPGRGYYAKSALGGSVPFVPEFYSFLAKGARAKITAAATPKAVYQVTIKGLPTDANSEARIKPQGTRLELQCVTGSQVISNMNYPVSKPFVWSPDACGDVLFQIDIGDTVLTRRYPGARGFADFLRDFPGGRHTFYPRQFPGEKQALERMGVRFIRVNYQLYGANEIATGEADALPGRVPAKIAECWD